MDLLKHLSLFDAVAEAGHFGRAAEEVGMAQPPLSQAIKRLEKELGCRLFHRTPRGAELTEVGRLVRDEVRRVREDVERLRAVAESQKSPPVELLVDPGLPESWGGRLASGAADAGILVRLTSAPTEEALLKVRSQGAMALVMAPIRTEQLRTSAPLRCALWETRPLTEPELPASAFIHPCPPAAALRVIRDNLRARGMIGSFTSLGRLSVCGELGAEKLTRAVSIGPPEWPEELTRRIITREIPSSDAGAVFQLVLRRDARDRDKLAAWDVFQPLLAEARDV